MSFPEIGLGHDPMVNKPEWVLIVNFLGSVFQKLVKSMNRKMIEFSRISFLRMTFPKFANDGKVRV